MANRNPYFGLNPAQNAGLKYKYILPLSFFLFAFAYFFFVANPLLFFQEQRSLFVFEGSFISSFFLKPGGLLELSGKFLTQFYTYRLTGSIIVAAVIASVVVLMTAINLRLNSGHTFSVVFSLLPACLLLLLQSHYYHYMEFNLGFVFTLGYFWLSISKNRKSVYLALVFFPLFYYVIGAYAFLYAAWLALHILLNYKHSERFVLPLILSVEIVLCIIVFKEVLFLQPLQQLLLFPLPAINNPAHKAVLYVLMVLIVLHPVLLKVDNSVQNRIPKWKLTALSFSLVIFTVTAFFLYKLHNWQTIRVIQIERYAMEDDWDELIHFQEKYPSQNLIGQYFYNVALSETGQLCDRLFFGEQDFGSNSLILPWGNEYLSWGGYFYYSVGLINEAHRWAYEGMVVDGLRPQTLKILVKTNLINGNFEMAKKYINILKLSLNYRSWALKYEELVSGNALVSNFPELETKRSILPKEDFFVQITSPQNNIPLLLNSNPTNKKAFEYEMAWFLLSKNVEGLINNLPRLNKLNYNKIPGHIEESILAYTNSTGEKPDLGGLTISNETISRFNQYISDFKLTRQSPSTQKDIMQKKYYNTFWFYFHFK